MSDDVEMVLAETLRKLDPRNYWTALRGTDAPTGGDYMHLSDVRRGGEITWPYDGVRVEYYFIPETGWGDYLGSTSQRSNFRVIMADHAEHLVTVRSDYSAQQLAVRLDGELPLSLYELIAALSGGDTWLLDEDDMCELEADIESENWESWGRSDFVREVRTLAEKWDRRDDVPELDESGRVDALWHSIRESGNHDWQPEGADGGHWIDLIEAADKALIAIRSTRGGKAPIPVMAGQLVLV